MVSVSAQQPTPPWVPQSCKFPLYETSILERNGRLTLDRRDAAAAKGGYGEVFPGSYVDCAGITYRVCAKRDHFLTMVDEQAAKKRPLFSDDEIRTFFARVRADLTAAWRLLGDPRVVSYLAVTTTTREVASGTVVLPEYFIMEKEGETLKTWLNAHLPCLENRLAFEGFVQCILEGLAALHMAGITHRDLNPNNVVVCRHDPSTVRIIDLGLATREVIFRERAIGSFMTDGTPDYMAPESSDSRRMSQAADVWAVGVMCARWILEEQLGSRKAVDRHIGDLRSGPNGTMAVHNRLREAASQSRSPESLLEQVASAALNHHAATRPSSIDLAKNAASAMSAEQKQKSFVRWVSHATHALRDCCSEPMDNDVRIAITSFLDVVSTIDSAQVCARLVCISHRISTIYSDPTLVRVARNIVQSLLQHNPSTAWEASLLHLLANLYSLMWSKLNYIRAVALYDRVIAIDTATFGAEHISGEALLAKASAMLQIAEPETFGTVEALLERVLGSDTAAVGADHPSVLVLRAKVLIFKASSQTVQRARVILEESIALYDRALDIESKTLGAHHRSTVSTLRDMAATLIAVGETVHLRAAVAICDRILDVAAATSGADPPGLAEVRSMKAVAVALLSDAANLDAAVALCNDTLDSNSSMLDADHPLKMATLQAKAIALMRAGGSENLRAAIALHDRVIAMTTTTWGADHTSTSASLLQKAKTLAELGGDLNLSAAMALCDRILEIDTAKFGVGHLVTAEPMEIKAAALSEIGGALNLGEAVALYDRVIKISIATSGAHHHSTAQLMQRKAIVLMRMGGSTNLNAAVSVFVQIFNIGTATHVLKSHPPETVVSEAKAMANVVALTLMATDCARVLLNLERHNSSRGRPA
jgi:serine/threonine protein kinase